MKKFKKKYVIAVAVYCIGDYFAITFSFGWNDKRKVMVFYGMESKL